MTRPRRVLLIGFDAAVPARWRALAESGALPVGRRLLADGCLAPCLPALPTLTTTNWATIATGAWPGTHGVTDFNPHRPGDVPDESLQGFDARDTRAEFVWEAVVRGGRDSAVVNWPGSWPPREWPVDRAGDGDVTPGRLTIVGGAGIELNEWRVGIPGRDRLVALAAEQRFSTDPQERGAAIVRLPLGDEPLALPFRYEASFSPVATAVTLLCSVVERAGRPAVRFWLQGAEEALAELAAGEWSERLTLPFEVDGATVPGSFRLKLLALDPRAGLFRLYVTDIARLSWLEQPAGTLVDPGRFAGLPTPGVGWESYFAGGIQVDTFVELTDMATRWLADVCAEVVAHRPCDLFCAHFHAIDSFYHLCSQGLDERLTLDPAERARFERAEATVYRQLDDALGRLLEVAGDEVLTVLVSDHGATPTGPDVPVAAILRDAGLLATAPASDGAAPIDWSRTLAVPQGSCFVRLNLAGRDPAGIVPPPDAERVRRRVIEALREYREPDTGLSPFTLVASNDEVAALGLWGDDVADVIYAVRPDLGDVHGPALPDATLQYGGWGMPSLCLFSGLGAAHGTADQAGGIETTAPVSLTDVAPTICHVLGVPLPAQCDGVVRFALLAPSPGFDTATLRRVER